MGDMSPKKCMGGPIMEEDMIHTKIVDGTKKGNKTNMSDGKEQKNRM